MKKLFSNEDTQLKVIFAGMIFVLLIVLIPLYIISHYNFMSMDDVGYAAEAEKIWDATHSVLKVFAAQFIYGWEYWKEWQGTFAAEWFCTALMGIFQRNAYYTGTYITLTGFVLTELILFLVILTRFFHADFFRSAIISFCVICLQILLTPYPVEAFYWFCGAMIYTAPYCEAMLLCTMLVLLYCHPRKLWKRILLYTEIILMTYMVSGGSYVTLIGMLCVYFLTAVWFWYRRHPEKYFVAASFLLYLIGFFVNVLAPGNQLRLSTTDMTGYPAFTAILLSLKEAAEYIATYLIPPCILLALLFLPLFANIVKKRNFVYPLPALVTLISFCVFAAQFTPNLYTLGFTGTGRIQNVYRWTFFIWLYANELYWVGWVLRKYDTKSSVREKACFLLPGWIVGGVAMIYVLNFWGGDLVTTRSAVYDLIHGGAQTYYEEYQERMEILEDDTITDAVLEPFSYHPYLLFFEDVKEDPAHWANEAYADYYGKNSVRLTGNTQ